MTLPKKTRQNLKSSRGQIIVLFLLVLVVGLAIVLSVASRTVTDIRITTTSDESNRAYFAAEAAIEEALKKVSSSGAATFTLDFTGLNQSEATVTIEAGSTQTYFVYPKTVAKDDVAQVNLLETWNDLSSTSWSGTLRIYWGASSVIDATTPAIEVAVIYKNNVSGNWVIPLGGISKTAFDPNTGRGNNFCPVIFEAPPKQLSGPQGNVDFHFSAEVTTISMVAENCWGLDAGSGTPVLARIRVLYASSPIAVEALVDDSGLFIPLPAQGDLIESSGNTPSGVTRKLQVTRLYPALPALFDYVLFSGSKTKPLKK